MMPSLKPTSLPQPDWPGIETERLILRRWRQSDIAANTLMLGDPARRLGASNEGETALLGLSVDLWVTRRSKWAGGN